METQKKTILIVDDDEKNRRLLEAMLVPLGYEVLFVPNTGRGSGCCA
jgi:CheY-like chemotaxis protein